MNLLAATTDSKLFAPWFKDRETWAAWFVFIASLFTLPMSEDQLAIFTECTGRSVPPSTPIREAWLVCGRRAGKSFILALIAVFLACFKEWRPYLSPGERGTIIVIAADRKQARVIMRYVRALLTQVPMLANMISRETAEAFDLANSVTIEVSTASFKSVRGYTLLAALCDEIAFWPTDDAAEPDYEVLDALRPGMATIPDAMLLCASSPYARRGALWDAHRRYYGKESPLLVWKATTRRMNPTVPQSVIDAAMERDASSASAEYGAEFRTDVERLLTREAVEGCVSIGLIERAPVPGISYAAFIDPSGGSSDSMTLCVAHREGDAAVIDCLRERIPPFNPADVTMEFANVLGRYRISSVHGDRYAGEWPRDAIRRCGIEYHLADKTASDLYLHLLPAINGRKVVLLDNDRLTHQLIGLERRTARSGRDLISHAPGGHDDVANVVAGAVHQILARAHLIDNGSVCGPIFFVNGQRL